MKKDLPEISILVTHKHLYQNTFIEVKKSSGLFEVGKMYYLVDYASKCVEKRVALVHKETIKFKDVDERISFLDKELTLPNYKRVLGTYLKDTDLVDVLTFATNFNPYNI